ncbi:MAG: TetR family transcriptional regulator [Ottowia sp.]|nr:TetR family transcriptional regulator [Ottowia sp.]
MLIKGTEDLRVQKTMAAIGQAFEALLLERDYEKISVTALCARARINKKTFYTYYENLDALLEEKLQTLAEKLLERNAKYHAPEELEEINREFFHYAAEQGALYEKIACSSAWEEAAGRMFSTLVQKTWSRSPRFQALDSAQQALLLDFLAVTGGGLYRQWVRSGKQMPMEEIIALSGALLCGGVNGFMERAGPASQVD